MKTEQNQKTTEGLPVHPDHAVGTLFQVAWQCGQKTGAETDVYTSFETAVEIAESLQEGANDRPINITFSVVRQTGNSTETVYRCHH